MPQSCRVGRRNPLPRDPFQALPFNPEEPFSPPSPQGFTSSLSLSLITPWVRLAPNLGPRFLLWEGPGNTGFSQCPKHPF